MIAQLMTIEELASRIKVKPKTIYSWAELGKIPNYKINGCLRFDFEEIEKWLEGCKNGPVSGIIGTAQTVAVPRKGR